MNPNYTDAERRAYATAMGDAARNYQATLPEAIRQAQEEAWNEGELAGMENGLRGKQVNENPYRKDDHE